MMKIFLLCFYIYKNNFLKSFLDNHDHRAKVRQALANDKEWQTNYITQVSPMYINQTNATMMLLPWSIITLPSKPGIIPFTTTPFLICLFFLCLTYVLPI